MNLKHLADQIRKDHPEFSKERINELIQEFKEGYKSVLTSDGWIAVSGRKYEKDSS